MQVLFFTDAQTLIYREEKNPKLIIEDGKT